MLRRRFALRLTSWLVILSLLLSNAPLALAQDGPVYLPLINQGKGQALVSASDLLFRVQVRVATPSQAAKLAQPGIVVLAQEEDTATLLVDSAQLEYLAKAGFQPRGADALEALVKEQGPDWLSPSLQPLVQEAAAARQRMDAAAGRAGDQVAALAGVRAAMAVLVGEQRAALNELTELDSDGDGLTDTEESWWCTDPLNPNSDGDAQGYSDGLEVDALLDFTLSRTVRWNYGPPFGPPAAWPDFNNRDGNTATPACNDGDYDTIPDYAEAYVVGTRAPDENTDGDKFDDGQEFFGVTFCPGGDMQGGWGNFPRTQDVSFITCRMPAWIRPPGDSPFVAAYPAIDFLVDPTTIKVTTKEIRTIERTVTQGEEISTGFAEMQGNSTTVGTIDTNTHSTWQENSTTEGGIEPAAVTRETDMSVDVSSDLAVLPKVPLLQVRQNSVETTEEPWILDSQQGVTLLRLMPSGELAKRENGIIQPTGVQVLSAKLLASNEVIFIDPTLALKKLAANGAISTLLPPASANAPLFVRPDQAAVAYLKPMDFAAGATIPDTNGIAVYDLSTESERVIFSWPFVTTRLYGWSGQNLIIEVPNWDPVTLKPADNVTLGVLPTDRHYESIAAFSKLPRLLPGSDYPSTSFDGAYLVYESDEGTVIASLQQPKYTLLQGAQLPQFGDQGLDVVRNRSITSIILSELTLANSSDAVGSVPLPVITHQIAPEVSTAKSSDLSTPLFYRPVAADTPVSAYYDLDRDRGKLRDWLGTSWTTPYPYPADSDWGFRYGHSYDNHDGTDFDGTEGDHVFAVGTGMVDLYSIDCANTYAAGTLSWGTTILLNHGALSDGATYSTRYAHLVCDDIYIQEDAQITSLPTWIADMGNTGYSSGAHLHFGVYRGNSVIDPYNAGIISNEGNAVSENPVGVCYGTPIKSTDPSPTTLPAIQKRTSFIETIGRTLKTWWGNLAGSRALAQATGLETSLLACIGDSCASQVGGGGNFNLNFSDSRSAGQCGGNSSPGNGSDWGIGGGGSGTALNNTGAAMQKLRVWSQTTTSGEGTSTSHSELRSETQYSEITRSRTNTLLSSEAWSTATTTDPTDAAILTFNYNLYNTGSDAAVRLTGIKMNILIGDLPVITRDLQDSFDILPGEAKGPFGSGDVKLTLDQLAAIDNGAPIRVVLADYGYDDNLYDANAWGRGVLFHVDDGTADGDEAVDTYLITTNLIQNESYQDTLARYFAVTTFQGANGDERNDTITGIRTPEFAPNGEITGWIDHPVNEHGWWELSVSLGGETAGVKHFKDMPAKPKTDVYLRYVLDTDADGYTDRAERDAGTDPADPQSHPKALVAVAQHTTVSNSTATVQVTLQNEGNFDASSVELWAIAPDDSITINDNLVGGGGRVRAGRQVVLGARIGRPDLTGWKTSTTKPYPEGQFEGSSAKTYLFQADANGGNIGTTADLKINWSVNGGASWTALAVGAGYTAWTPLPLTDGLTIAFSPGYVGKNETFSFATALPIDTFSYSVNRSPYTRPLIIASYNDPEGNHKFVSDVELADIQDDLAPYLGRMRYGFQMDVMGETAVVTGTNTAYIVFNNPSDTTIAGGNVFVEFATPDGTVAKEYVLANQTFLPGPNVTALTWSTADFSPAFDPAKDYHILAFAADRQGTIFENTVKDLDQVGQDRLPIFVMANEDATWNFGAAQQGTLLKRSFTFANTGFGNLMASVVSSGGRWERTISSLTPTWIDTGIVVQLGERVGVRAGGVACYATAGTTACFGPEGRGDTPTSTLVPGLSALSLVGRIGDGAPFLVGQASTVTADRAGRLYLATNDCTGCYGDNAGAYATHIEVYGLPIDDGRGLNIVAGDSGSIELLLNTHYLATGPFERDLVIRTSDPGHITRTMHVAGTITDFSADTPPSAVQRPLDVAATVSGVHGQWVDFAHSLQPTPESLHPVKVYSQDYGVLKGVGRYATPFGQGTASSDLFGNSADGDLVVNPGTTYQLGSVSTNLATDSSIGQTNIPIYSSSGFAVGDEVLIHQAQGPDSGSYEFNRIAAIQGQNFVLAKPLRNSYRGMAGPCGGNFLAQYYSNRDLAGTPVLQRCEASVANDADGGSPGPGVPADNYSVRWTARRFISQAGTYGISVWADDGVRVYVDGSLVINQWRDQGVTWYPADITLSAGWHTVTVEYYEAGGGSFCSLGFPGDFWTTQILRVPNYRNVTIEAGSTLTAKPWNGLTGGVVAFRASGTANVLGTISADGIGYRGGDESRTEKPGTHAGEGTSGHYNDFHRDCWGGRNANGNGGGSGHCWIPDGWGKERYSSGGGGGGNATDGGGGQCHIGTDRCWCAGGGGYAVDAQSFSRVFLGGGGGSGGVGQGNFEDGGAGGDGGGIIFASAFAFNIFGAITMNGQVGRNVVGYDAHMGSAGGGGSGGTAYLSGSKIAITGQVQANGGLGGITLGQGGGGGGGGLGRIRIDYCETLAGSTNPPASTSKLNCYIADQAADPTRGLLQLPAGGANTYQVQYGRKLDYTGAATQVTTLRVPAGIFTSVSLQALVANLPSNASFALDVGNTGSASWNGAVSNGGEYTSPNLAAAFNAYWASHGAPTTGYLNVPIRVYLDRAGQVLLTNLQVTLTGSKTRYIRLSDRQGDYSNATLNFLVSGGNGSLAAGVDVGADGSIDWTYAGAPPFPASLTTDNIASAVNAYLATHWNESGDLDVPILIYTSPFNPVALNGFTATPGGQSDISIGPGDVTFGMSNPYAAPARNAAVVVTSGNSIEGETVTINTTVHNSGVIDTGTLIVNFFATPSDGRRVSIGSEFLANVPAGGAETVSLSWPTLGFTGLVTITAAVDSYNRITETNETNNQATASLTILTRPDLTAPTIALSDPEPLAGKPVTITVTLRNGGQTPGNSQVVTLYNGNPAQGGAALGSRTVSIPANATRTAVFTWTPPSPGPYRLLARVDRTGVVNEFDETNNDTWFDLHVGLASPVLLDSGAAGEPAYTPARGYGFVDEGQPDAVIACDATSQRRDPDGRLVYRFDHLQPGHYYHLDLHMSECDGAGRRQTVYVDGYPVSGVRDLGDSQPDRLSILLDPALYADRTIRVTVEAEGIDGAVVDQVNLHDIDYRYADAGGGRDPQCSDTSSFGWVDGVPILTWGTLPYKSVRVDQSDNTLRYCFKAMNPAKRYNVHFTFWQPSGSARSQSILIDGVDAGIAGSVAAAVRNDVTAPVPLSAYQSDGRIDVSIVRTNAASGAMVNLLVLEEETLAASAETPTGTAVLELRPAAATTGLGQSVSLDVWVRTAEAVDGAAAFLDFDPTYLQVAALTPGNSLPTVLQRSFDNTLGRIDFSAGALTGAPLSSDFLLATVVFTGVKTTAGTPVTLAATQPRRSDVTYGGKSVYHHSEGSVVTVTEAVATLAGHVTPPGRPASPDLRWRVPLRVTLSTTPGGPAVAIYTPTSDDSGNFVVAGISPGVYRVGVKMANSLRNAQVVTFTNAQTSVDFGLLRGGDANDDNYVTVLDFSILRTTFGKCQADPGYDSRADFNGDECVTIVDFSIMRQNFGKGGDELRSSDAAWPVAEPTAGLRAEPAAPEIAVGQQVAVPLRVDAGGLAVDGAAAYLTFDPAVIQVAAVSPGDALSDLLQNEVDNQAGTVRFAAGGLEQTATGEFDLAVLNVRAVGPGDAALHFVQIDPLRSDVTAAGASVLSTVSSGALLVSPGDNSATTPKIFLPLIDGD